MENILPTLGSNCAASQPRFRNFATGVSFTVEETMRKLEADCSPCVPFVPVEPNVEAADLDFISFESTKHQKVIYDGLDHYEKDLAQNILKDAGLRFSTSWRTIRIQGYPGATTWHSPLLMLGSTHTIVQPIGPESGFGFPIGHLSHPLRLPVHSALLIENSSTHLKIGSDGYTVFLLRGAQ